MPPFVERFRLTDFTFFLTILVLTAPAWSCTANSTRLGFARGLAAFFAALVADFLTALIFLAAFLATFVDAFLAAFLTTFLAFLRAFFATFFSGRAFVPLTCRTMLTVPASLIVTATP